MKTYKIILTAFLLSIGAPLFAQTGIIKGIINTSDGVPAEFVNIGLKGTNKNAIASARGEYIIKNVEPGSYILVTSFVGLETKETQVEVKANETTQVTEISLTENSKTLNEIVVTAKGSKYEISEYASKMPLKNLENPQVYNSIDSKVMKEQIVINFSDALKNAPGVEKLWESTGRAGDGAGYYSMRGFSVQPTLVNGLPGLTNGSLDPANIERIEVLKGPSGTLFGSSLISYGGLINTITKKPYQAFGGEINYITGSFGLNRITADVNAPLGKEDKVAVRLNAAYGTENSFQDAGFKKSILVAPSLSFKATDKLSFLMVTEFLDANGTNPTMLFLDRGAALSHPDVASIGYNFKRSYTSNNLAIRNITSNLQAQLLYKLSNSWTSQTIASSGTAQSKGYYSYLYESTQYFKTNGTVFGRYISGQNASTNTADIQQNFIGNFNLSSSIKNKVVAGLDYYLNTSIDNSTGWARNGLIYIGDEDSTTLAAIFGGPAPANHDSGNLTKEATDALLGPTGSQSYETRQETYSAYFSDVISLEPLNLSAMISLRYDYFSNKGNVRSKEDDYEQGAVSPKFGLIYQPVKDRVSIFANYMNGFMNVAPAKVSNKADGSNPQVKSFKPEQANQWEGGVKTNLLKDKLTATFSYYDILVSNKVMPDPANTFNSIQGGKIASKGAEVDLHTSPVEGLDISLGYSYNESKVLAGAPGNLFSYVGRRPAESGPNTLYNAWATYKFTGGGMKGFGIGYGLNGASKRLIMDSEEVGRFSVPAYTIMNASVFYKAARFQLTFKVDNLTNEIYYKGWSTINPQRPRSVAASFAYSF